MSNKFLNLWALGFGPVIVLGRAKIYQFHYLIFINQNVFILDITMHYAVHVQIRDSSNNLKDDTLCYF